MAGRFSWAFGKRRGRSAVGVYTSAKSLFLAQLTGAEGTAGVRARFERSLSNAADAATQLKLLVKEQHLAKSDCVLTLDSSAYSLLQVEKPNVPAAELLPAVRWRIRDLLGFPVDEAVIDAFEVPGMESRGRPPSLYVAAAKRVELKAWVDAAKAAGLNLSRINISEMAMRGLATRLAANEESVGVLSLGERSGTLAVMRERTLFVTRRLDVDANDAAAIAGGEATEPARRRVFERIALEVQRTLDYFDGTFQRAPVRRIFVLAAADGLADLPQALRDNLGVAASFADLQAALGAADVGISPAHSGFAIAAAGALSEVEA